MAKPVISPEEFVKLVNERLPNHFAYEPGSSVYLVPPGADGKSATGYDFKGSTKGKGAMIDVANQVHSEYDVNPHISRAAL